MAILISIMSLFISIATFVITNVRVRHQLYAVVDDEGLMNEDDLKDVPPNKSRMRIVLVNHGNRPETLIGASYAITRFDGSRVSDRITTPVVLKPGESHVLAVTMLSESLLGALSQKMGFWTDFGFKALVVLPNGSIGENYYPVGQVRAEVSNGSAVPYLEVRHFRSQNIDLIDSRDFAFENL